MKQRTGIEALALTFVVAMMVGCAAHTVPGGHGAFNPKTFDGMHYGPKIDHFMVILDASSSMTEPAADGVHQKFVQAKAVLERMNMTLPDMAIEGGLRSFGHSIRMTRDRTRLVYGPTDYTRSGFQGGLDKVARAGGSTPMTAALEAAAGDLAKMTGKIAVIVVGDGLATDNSPLQAAEAMKAEFGERLCIYTVHVGGNPAGRAVMEGIAGAGKCGFTVTAEEILAADAMADFVEKVFLTRYVDTDGDGVYDHLDKCPGTPRGVKVDAAGCPLDSDGDGVYDYMDKCPGTPKGVKVDAVGCPLDSDGDGVSDDMDKCPGTPAGAKVNADGCWVLGDVLFDFDKAVIKTTAYGLLDEVVRILKSNPGLNVSLDGHTDNVGGAAYNMALSGKRADAVKAYLVGKGVDAGRLAAEGFGLTKPVVSNDTDGGRAMNRRVEIRPIR